MRRILATLAVLALLFSAGSAWADFDDGVAVYDRRDYPAALQELLPGEWSAAQILKERDLAVFRDEIRSSLEKIAKRMARERIEESERI